MKILMSIKPKYVAKIMSGEKKFELRKRRWHQRGLERIVIYSSSPVQRLIGEVEVKYIDHIDPTDEDGMWASWDLYGDGACVSQQEFFAYFANSKNGYAIRIGKIHLYDRPYTLQEKYPHLKRPPQSFCYVED